MMKKDTIRVIMLFTILLILIFSLAGFKNIVSEGSEVEDNFFILAAAIDESTENSGNVRLTVLSRSFEENSAEKSTTNTAGSSNTKSKTFTAEGSSVLDATRNLSAIADKHIFWSHIRYILISEEVARKDVLDFLDFINRDLEIRFDAHMFVVKGLMAKKIFDEEIENGRFTPDILKGLLTNSIHLSFSRGIKVREILINFENGLTDVTLPILQLEYATDKKENKSKSTLNMNGLAVFKGTSLLDFITDETTLRGVSWITGNVKSGILELKDIHGSGAVFEIIDSQSQIKTSFKNGIPEVTAIIKLSTNLSEQKSNVSLIDKPDIEYLEAEQDKLVKKEAKSAVDFSQVNGVDILGIGDSIYHKNPLKWTNMKESWKTLYPKIKFNIIVESKINRSYLIQQPVESKKYEER